MTTDSPDPKSVLAYGLPPQMSIGQTTARGIVWTVAQSMISKLIVTAGQIVLAWWLVPGDYGAVGMALTVFSLASLFQQPGLQQILVQRHKRFRTWATPAFWMSLSAGFITGVGLLAFAPVAAKLYRAPQILGMIRVLAIAGPLGAISFVPTAKLQAELRFRSLAVVNFWNSTATIILSILLAWLGYGGYSFIIPRPIVAAVQGVVLLWWARPPIKLSPQLRRWRFLVADSGLLFGVSICILIITQGDYITLGLRYDAEVLGLYYFAFNQSTQVAQLLAANLTTTLMSAMSQLQSDRPRVRDSFVRASQIISLVGMPLCLVQAAAARPLFHLLFQPKWEPCIPLFQILSIGMAFTIAGLSSGSLFQAMGRFREMFAIHVFFAALFVGLVYVGTTWGAATGTAIAVTIHAIVIAPIHFWWAIRPLGAKWRDLVRTFLVPLAGALSAAAMALAMSSWTGQLVDLPTRAQSIVQLAVISVVMPAVYLPYALFMAPESISELRRRLLGR